MSTIDFRKWRQAPTAKGAVVPYLQLTDDDPPVPFLFDLGGVGFVAKGNLTTFKGSQKAGKSAAGLCLMAAALCGKCGTVTPRQATTEILWVDTEQDKATLREKARAVLTMAGLEELPPNLHIVPMRQLAAEERVPIMLQACEECRPDLLFLDGIVDLCTDFNEGKESKAVVQELLLTRVCDVYGCAVVTVIHTNKQDKEARGHLGSFVQQKSGQIMLVEKTGCNATVTEAFSRFAPVPAFSYTFADNFIVVPQMPADLKAKRMAELRQQFAKVMQAGTKMRSGELAKEFANVHHVSLRAARTAMADAVFCLVLTTEKEGKKVFYTLFTPEEEKDEFDEFFE